MLLFFPVSTLHNLLHFLRPSLVFAAVIAAAVSTNSSASNYTLNSSSSTAVEKYRQQLVEVSSSKFTEVADSDDYDDGNEDGDDENDHWRPSWSSMVILVIITKSTAH